MLITTIYGYVSRYSNWTFYQGDGLDTISDKAGFYDFKLNDKNYEVYPRITTRKYMGYTKINIQTASVKTFIKIPIRKTNFIFGMGQQFSYWNLQGRIIRNVPREDGIGRVGIVKKAIQLQTGKQELSASYIISPHFITSNGLSIVVDNLEYSEFQFCYSKYIMIKVNSPNVTLTLFDQMSITDHVKAFTELYGKQPLTIPEWTQNGAIVGLMGGSKRTNKIMKSLLDRNTSISAVWIQDWCGLVHQEILGLDHWRVNWNWVPDNSLYMPSVKDFINEWHSKGIKVLGYVNPFLVNTTESNLFKYALANDLLVKSDGELKKVNQGPNFSAYMIDLLNPIAYNWFRSILVNNLSVFNGFMADFGEYYPYEYTNSTGHLEYIQKYTALVNSIDTFTFMRSGTIGVKSMVMWSGDQMHSYSRFDGLKAVLQGYLQASVSGYGFMHSDIGGYTSVIFSLSSYEIGFKRVEDLLIRWMEFSVFEAVYRTHEGTLPLEIKQVYSNPKMMDYFKQFTQLFAALKPYREEIMIEYASNGLGLMRPMYFYHKELYKINNQFYFGKLLIVAPILDKYRYKRSVVLPYGEWIHICTGIVYLKGKHVVKAHYGQTPIFIEKKHYLHKSLADYIALMIHYCK